MKSFSFDEYGNPLFDFDDIESLTPEEFDRLCKKQESILSLDAKDVGPYWLEKIQGSLSEERRESISRKEILYNRLVSTARKFRNTADTSLEHFLTNQESVSIKLSELWARYPSIEISLGINLQTLTQSSMKLLRSFVLVFEFNRPVIDPIAQVMIDDELERVLRKNDIPVNLKILKEIKIIRYIFLILEYQLAVHFIYSVYRKDNIDRWLKTGQKLASNYSVIQIPYWRTKQKVRRRGYRESHPNNKITTDQRGKVKMSNEYRSIIEIKEEIKRKQAILFERRLDAFLAMEDSNLPISVRKEIFDSLIDDEATIESIRKKEKE